ncbi:MAG: lysophospholipid acyltransferase family protein [Anaerovorax sp.]
MKLVKNIGVAIWMYCHLFTIAKLYRTVKKYRKSQQYELERDTIRRMQHKWGLDVTGKGKIKINAVGLEKIPPEPCVFVANHQSYLDLAVFTAAIDRQMGFISKKSLKRLPAFGKFIYSVRSVYIDSEDARGAVAVIEKGIEHLKLGFSMGIFPEGRRSKGPEMGEFKRGSLRLATKPGVPVVPVTISGTYQGFEEQGWFVPVEVDFFVHDPIETKGMGKKEANALGDTVEKIVKDKLLALQNKGKA